jgi:glyoxylase-like metal-dependent hydrolase (beta-lactamase superfamily II)
MHSIAGGRRRQAGGEPQQCRDAKEHSQAVRTLAHAIGKHTAGRHGEMALFLLPSPIRVARAFLLTMVLVMTAAPGAVAQDARAVLDAAAQAMGTASLDSITYAGTAAVANFGQSRTISFGLASTTLRNYTRTIDFATSTARTTALASPPAVHGGPPPGPFDQITTSETGWPQQSELWVTPWGFLRGASAGPATVRSQKVEGTAYRVVTWTPPRKAPSGQPYRVVGYIGPQNLVERIETWVEHPVLGDLHVENTYTNYFDAGGVKVPGRIAQRRVGMEVFVAVIGTARANPPDLRQLLSSPSPADAAASAGADSTAPTTAVAVTSEKLADGVYRIAGGYTALVVELRDYVVVLGGGPAEARGQAVLAEARRLAPNKTIKYVVNTHPHFDHASVLPPFAAEGITILTDDPNRYFLEQALGSPRTLVGDALAKSRKKPKVESVVEKLVLRDSLHSIELHHLERFEHSDGMLVAYLPRERILFAADIEVPAAGQPAGAALAGLAQNLERLQLDFDRLVIAGPSSANGSMTRAEMTALTQRSK